MLHLTSRPALITATPCKHPLFPIILKNSVLNPDITLAISFGRERNTRFEDTMIWKNVPKHFCGSSLSSATFCPSHTAPENSKNYQICLVCRVNSFWIICKRARYSLVLATTLACFPTARESRKTKVSLCLPSLFRKS